MTIPAIALVQGVYEAFGRTDPDHIVAALTPDVRWEIVGGSTIDELYGPQIGPENVRRFLTEVGARHDYKTFEVHGAYADQDKVFVLGRQAFTMLPTGAEIDAEFVHVWTVRDGKIAGFREFSDTAQALATRA